jgi:hypothetical protein
VILTFVELTTEFFLNATCVYAQCPLGRALQNSQEFLSATVFFSTALPPEVFNNLKVFPELMISASVPSWHVFV